MGGKKEKRKGRGGKKRGGKKRGGKKRRTSNEEKEGDKPADPSPLKLSNTAVIVSAVVCSLFWGLAFVWIKMALDDLRPVELTVWRFIVASLLFLPILVWKRREVAKIRREDVPGLVVIGIIGMAGYHFFLNWGEQYTYSGTASLIIATIPIMVVVASTRLLGERLTATKVVGLMLALAGVTVLSVQGGVLRGEGTQTFVGVIAVFVSALTGVAYTIGGKRYLERYDPLVFIALGTMVSLALMLPWMLWEGVTPLSDISSTTMWAVLCLGALSTIVSYGLFFTILKHREASRTSMYVYLVPVFAVGAGVLLLGEELGMLTLVGAALVLAGVYIVNRKV